AAGARRPDPVAMGEGGAGGARAASAAQVLPVDAQRAGGIRGVVRALSAAGAPRRRGEARMTQTILRAASWLVPAARRRDWLTEWRAELWHIERVAPRRTTAFALGAFRDALWLRREDPPPVVPDLLASPVRRLALLAILAGT